MADPAQLKILRQGVEDWNRWRERHAAIEVNLSGALLTNASLREAALQGANLREANLSSANLKDANLVGADLTRADLRGAHFGGANLSTARMGRANLSTANLSAANLGQADLSGAQLIGVDFSGADLIGADLHGADIQGADLLCAHLRAANLCGANLAAANLGSADLSGANFSAANLDRANLTDSWLNGTLIGDVDLSNVKGLEEVRHFGPSTIGIDTVYRSQGKIAESFLRGAGLPGTFIEYMRSLVTNPIEYYSCFISYSSKDEEFAKRLHRDLQGEQVRCWFAPEDLKIGDEIRPRIDEAIRIHDKLLIVLSENSVGSPWVRKEVETALGKEIKFEAEQKQRRTVLFPIRLDDSVMRTEEAWAADIKLTRHIGDFREWKSHDRYKETLGRLLRDLKAEQRLAR